MVGIMMLVFSMLDAFPKFNGLWGGNSYSTRKDCISAPGIPAGVTCSKGHNTTCTRDNRTGHISEQMDTKATVAMLSMARKPLLPVKIKKKANRSNHDTCYHLVKRGIITLDKGQTSSHK